MITGSGSFFTFQSSKSVISSMASVGISVMERLPSTTTAPVTGDEIADEAHRDDHGPRRDHRHRDRVDELALVQPVVLVHHASVEERHDREAAAEHEGSGLAEEQSDLHEERPVDDRGHAGNSRELGGNRHHGPRLEPAFGRRFHQPRDDARDQEKPHNFRLRHDGDCRGDEVERPQQPVLADRFRRELVRADRDDPDHRGADAVEHGLHPGESAVGDVSCSDSDHHEERRQHEREPHQRRSEDAVVDETEVDRELRGERPRCELRKGQPFAVILLGNPLALLHEIAMHVAHQRDRAAEAESAKAQRV